MAPGLTLMPESGRSRITSYAVGRFPGTQIPLGCGEVMEDGTHLSQRWVRPGAAPVTIRPARPLGRPSVLVDCLGSGCEHCICGHQSGGEEPPEGDQELSLHGDDGDAPRAAFFGRRPGGGASG